jgi:hypothetical protein
VNKELENIYKDVHGIIKVPSQYMTGGSEKKTHNALVMIAGVPTEIRTENFLNISLATPACSV